MNFIYDDKNYMQIVRNILSNEEFRKIENLEHHGITRLSHCIRVSYFSYKITKFFRLNAVKTARAGLLHDFFLTNNELYKDKIKSVFNHSKKAVQNADDCFIISEMEKDIIETHMFPVASIKPPKYMEGWIVCGVDKVVALYEFLSNYSNVFYTKIKNASVIITWFLAKMF